MATEKYTTFVNNRFFEIPKYQRSFSWEIKNIVELIDDIRESIETNSSHYIGTFVLSKNRKDIFNIVDGQQRIMSITMIINCLIEYLDDIDKIFYKRQYIVHENNYRLTPQSRDQEYFLQLLKNNIDIEPQSKSQRLLNKAYREIIGLVENIKDKKTFLKTIENLQVVQFIEDNESEAIRIFQTVNDRGKPLSIMEKSKSLLIYFSNKYLKGILDNEINNKFGEIFEMYDDIKLISEKNNVSPIKRTEFTEDDIMKYHFITYSDLNYDATAEYVLEYLKERLSYFRKKSEFKVMTGFIVKYYKDLYNFFKSLKEVIEKVEIEEKYYKLFSILGISTRLYPLIIKLNQYKLLDKKIQSKNYTILDIIELIDVRVYKTHGEGPRAEISRFTYNLKSSTKIKEIIDWLLWYNRYWMPKEQFLSSLSKDIYGNEALVLIFIELCEDFRKKYFTLDELKEMVNKKPTIEHILPQTPKFDKPRYFGFKSKHDYLEYEHTLGNLTLLEEKLNKSIQNKNPTEKSLIYSRSIFAVSNKVSAIINTQKNYTKKELTKRTNDLANILSKRYWC